MLDETPATFALFTELPNGKIELDEDSGCPTMRISAEELACKTLEFIGGFLGDDLARLTSDYNANVECIREQHQYVLSVNSDNSKLRTRMDEVNRENDNAKKALAVQKTALNQALQSVVEEKRKLKIAETQRDKAISAQAKAEAELDNIKKKLAEQKKKTALAEGQINNEKEKVKWYKHKLTGISKDLDILGENAVKVAEACLTAQAIMKSTGRVVEAVVEAPSGPDLKIAKCPLNVAGHNDTNVRLAASGYDISLKHNYYFIIDDGMKGQQYVFYGNNGELISFTVPSFTKWKNVKQYMLEQFQKVVTEDFDALDKDTDFYQTANKFNELIRDLTVKLKSLTDKLDPAEGKENKKPVMMVKK